MFHFSKYLSLFHCSWEVYNLGLILGTSLSGGTINDKLGTDLRVWPSFILESLLHTDSVIGLGILCSATAQ